MALLYWLAYYAIEVYKQHTIIFSIYLCKKKKRDYLLSIGVSILIIVTLYMLAYSAAIMSFAVFALTLLTVLIPLQNKTPAAIARIILFALIISLVDGVIAGAFCSTFDIDKQYLTESVLGLATTFVSLLVIQLINIIITFKQTKSSVNIFGSSLKYELILIAGVISSMIYLFTVQSSALVSRNSRAIIFLITLTGLMFVAICILYFFILRKNDYYKHENTFFKEQLKMQEEYYSSLLKNEEYTRRLRHDINHHLSAISQLISSEQYIETKDYISELVEVSDTVNIKADTGNRIINIVINDLWNGINDIKLKWIGLVSDKILMSDLEICVVFSNILKNAIESTRKCQKNRVIEMVVKKTNSAIYIKCSNPISAPIIIRDGRPATTKRNKSLHGLGLVNVESVVEKYSGSITYDTQNNQFVLEIVLEGVFQDTRHPYDNVSNFKQIDSL